MSFRDRARIIIEILVGLTILVVGGLALNVGAGSPHWPGPLDLVRRYPWWTVLGLVVLFVLFEVLTRRRNEARARRADPSLVWALPHRNRKFTGRETLLTQLHTILAKGGTATLHALHGIGGVGKTQLATEYAHRHLKDYRLIAFFNAERADLLPGQFASLGSAMGLKMRMDQLEASHQVRSSLSDWAPWLLIFDNAESPAELSRFLPAHTGDVVVTTRHRGWASVGDVVDIDVFGRDESLELLAKRVPGIEPLTARGIADLLGDLPLAIEQASAFMEQTSTDPEEYLALLRPRLASMLNYGEVADRPGETVATLWRMSVRKLYDRNPVAVQLLEVISVLAPEPIPLDLFTNNASPSIIGRELANEINDPVAWRNLIGAITGFGLARRDGATVSMHRLVSAAIRADMDTIKRDEIQREALRMLRADLPGKVRDTPGNRARWAMLFPHVLTAVDTNLPDVRDKQIWLLDRAASSRNRLWDGGDLTQVRDKIARLVDLTATIYGANDIRVCQRLTSLGNVLSRLGNQTEAAAAYDRALLVLRQVKGANEFAIVELMTEIGTELLKDGRRDEGLDIWQEALAYCEMHTASRETQAAAGNLRELLHRAGRYLP